MQLKTKKKLCMAHSSIIKIHLKSFDSFINAADDLTTIQWVRRGFEEPVFMQLYFCVRVQSQPRPHSSVFCPDRGTCGWISSSDECPPSVLSTGALLFFFFFTFSLFFFEAFSPSRVSSPPFSPSALFAFPFLPPLFFFFFFLSSVMAAWSPFFFLRSHFSFKQAELRIYNQQRNNHQISLPVFLSRHH